MGGFFGAVCSRDVVLDVFFGTDYHSHLGTKNAGMAIWNPELGCMRQIHSIENVPFRTKFEEDLPGFKGCCGIGCISDTDPQPLMLSLRKGVVAMATVGIVNNAKELEQYFLDKGHHFTTMNAGKLNVNELVAALVNEKEDIAEGIHYAQDMIDGTITMMLMTGPDNIIVSRDKHGRLPVHIGKSDDGYCVSFESFAYHKLGYTDAYELGPGEIVSLSHSGYQILSPAHPEDLKICAFLWAYYGYPNSNYEGINVEMMRYRNGEIMARDEIIAGSMPKVDYVAGMPDSGIPHAIGYANRSGKFFARPFVKYTPTWPRSFTPENQKVRNQVAKMKQIPVPELIEGKKLMIIDDSIVRGTQMRETVDFLYESGASEVHMRSACPPLMYPCRFLNFSRGESEMDLLARRVIHELEGDEGKEHIDEYSDFRTERGQCLLKSICDKFGFDSLSYQSLDGLLEAIGLDRDKVCTYCWTGKE